MRIEWQNSTLHIVLLAEQNENEIKIIQYFISWSGSETYNLSRL